MKRRVKKPKRVERKKYNTKLNPVPWQNKILIKKLSSLSTLQCNKIQACKESEKIESLCISILVLPK